MKIAVTGGAGFIGQRLVEKLLQRGHNVVVVDMKQPHDPEGVEFRNADVERLDEVKPALEGVDCVYHLAGFVVETMRKNPYKGCRLQLDGTLNVLEACRLNGAKKVLLASSFYVYDGLDPNMVVNEQTRLDVREMEIFGASKLMAEALTREYSKKYGLNYVILRYGSAYGYGECSNVIKTFLEMGLRGETIEVWGEGKRRNQYTYVDDLAEGSVLALESVNQTYNLVSPEETTTGELAGLLRRKYGLDIVFNTVQKEGPSMAYMSSRKAIKELGWRPIELDAGVEKMMSQMRATVGQGQSIAASR